MNSGFLPENIRAIGQIGTKNLRRAWDWWSGEMMSIMPEGARQAIIDRKQILFVSLDDSHADVRLYRGGKSKSIAGFALQPGSANGKAEIRSSIDKLTPWLTASIVQIPEKYALQRTLTLPLDTEENLENVLGFEMDRLTPFTKYEVYFDFAAIDRDKAQRTIDLDFTVVKRRTVDKIVDTLADYGVQPTVLTVSDKPYEPQSKHAAKCANNLLPYERRAHPSRQKPYLPIILTVLVALLAATTMALPLINQSRVLLELDATVTDVKSAAMAAEVTRGEINTVIQQRRFFARKRAQLPTVVQMLDEITRVLPDDTALIRFEISGTRLRIHGESTSASSLISLIEGAKFFHNASFSSPVTKNPRTNKDRFSLEAELIMSGDDS